MALQPFQNRPVIRAAVKITKAGDGLSDALKVEPVELNIGDRVFYVLEGEVANVGFKRVHPASNELERVHTIYTQRITAVDAADVTAYLDDAEQHLRRALAEISDDQQTLDDEAARQAEERAKVAEANGSDPDGASVTDLVEKVKRARKKPAAAEPVEAT